MSRIDSLLCLSPSLCASAFSSSGSLASRVWIDRDNSLLVCCWRAFSVACLLASELTGSLRQVSSCIRFFLEGFLWKRNRFVCPLCAVAVLTLVSGEGEGEVEGKGSREREGRRRTVKSYLSLGFA